MSLPPRAGFELAWAGEVEPGHCTDREFAPVLDMLDAIESAPASPQLPAAWGWSPITSELLTRVRDGLQSR